MNPVLMCVRRQRRALAVELLRGYARRTASEKATLFMLRAWEELVRGNPRVATALELELFAGYDAHGVAAATGRSLQTGALDLRFGNAWLLRSLRKGQARYEVLPDTNGSSIACSPASSATAALTSAD